MDTSNGKEPPCSHGKFCTKCEDQRKKAYLDHLDEKTLLRDEIRALKAETAAYLDSIGSLEKQLQAQKDQDAWLLTVGKQVRLRYLEQHRRRMGMNIGPLGVDRIKCGDRAAHRGRPVEDAMIYLSGLRQDEKVYKDLYGIKPKTMKRLMGIEEIVDATKFRASLQSEGRLTPRFQEIFDTLLEATAKYSDVEELKGAFKKDRGLEQCHNELQDCYDQIIAQKKGSPGPSKHQS